jgi:hypothetical protein
VRRVKIKIPLIFGIGVETYLPFIHSPNFPKMGRSTYKPANSEVIFFLVFLLKLTGINTYPKQVLIPVLAHQY